MWEALIYLSLGALFGFFGYTLVNYLFYRKTTHNLEAYFNQKATKKHRRMMFWLFETDVAIIKCQYFKTSSAERLILTNQTTWIRNSGTEPIKIDHALPNVDKFILNRAFDGDGSRPVIRVAILHPPVKKLMKYINENERIVFDYKTKVNDCYFVPYHKLIEDIDFIINFEGKN